MFSSDPWYHLLDFRDTHTREIENKLLLYITLYRNEKNSLGRDPPVVPLALTLSHYILLPHTLSPSLSSHIYTQERAQSLEGKPREIGEVAVTLSCRHCQGKITPTSHSVAQLGRTKSTKCIWFRMTSHSTLKMPSHPKIFPKCVLLKLPFFSFLVSKYNHHSSTQLVTLLS